MIRASHLTLISDSDGEKRPELVPPDITILAWGVFAGPEEATAKLACAAAIEEAITSGELRFDARGWEKKRAALVERVLTEPRHGGRRLDRIHSERLDTWTTPRNPEKAALCQAALPLIREPVTPPAEAFPLLRWLLGKAADGLALTDRHYIVPRLVTEAVEAFGWRRDLVGTLTREYDVFPLQTIRELAAREMKAIRRTGKQLVLTPLGRRMLTDDTLLWDTAVSCLIGHGHAFTITTREIMLAHLLTTGPVPDLELERRAGLILGLEWNTPGGLAEPIHDERLLLRHRLWALDCHRPARRFDAPFALTRHGVTAATAALRAHALRPRFTLGFG